VRINNEMYLVTSALREFWPKSGSVWLLSPGCSPDPDEHDLDSRWEVKGVVSDPFLDKQEIAAAYAEICRITEDLIRLLAVRLNVVHNTNHSELYWRTHIGFWALQFVSMVYDRHARLLKAKAEIDHVVVIGGNDANLVIPSDTLDFYLEATDDLFNQQICTFLCKKLEIPVAERKIAASERKQKCPPSGKGSFVRNCLKKVMYLAYATLASIFAQRADVLMIHSYLPRPFEIALLLVTRGKIFPLHLHPRKIRMGDSSKSPINEASRSLLSSNSNSNCGITSLVIEMVYMCLPKIFVEDYEKLCLRSDTIYKNYRPKVIYSANLWWYGEDFKHWAAKCQEQGAVLVNGTHGGGAFIHKYKIFEMLEIAISDYYLTWGWTDPKDSRILGIPANILVNVSKRTKRVTSDCVLYVGTIAPRHNAGTLENFSDYLEWQKRFFDSIHHGLVEKLLLRMHYLDFDWKIKRRLIKVVPTLQFDSWEVSFRKKIRGARVCVFDYLSTTFAESLASNIPTVIFFDESKYPVFEDMAPYFQALKDAHILHETPEDAAAWVANVFNDTDSWWLSESCQKAVKEFCYLYARTSKKPLRDWINTFNIIKQA
jgi:putative transferase (TIGR04331 family)